jgi:hypothetical protein
MEFDRAFGYFAWGCFRYFGWKVAKGQLLPRPTKAQSCACSRVLSSAAAGAPLPGDKKKA